MSDTLKITDLSKKYYNKIALRNVNLNFKKGKIYGLLGPNGSGKTTLMKIITGLHKQTSGEVLINDKILSHETKGYISYMPTENYLYDNFKVKSIVNYYDDMYDDFRKELCIQILNDINIDLNFKVSKLSSGLRGKLKVALALSRDVDIYILDEPLNGVDLLTRDTIIDLIIKSHNENKVIIISSHLFSELEQTLDNVIFLKDGEIALQGNAEELRQEYGQSIENIYKEVYKNA